MKQVIVIAIRIVAALECLFGFIMFFNGVADANNYSSNNNSDMEVAMGIGMVLSSIVVYSFSYIVQAACIYIQKNENTI